MLTKYEQIRSHNPVIRLVQDRLWQQNKNWLAVLAGATGSGKSWSAIRLASEIDPNFSTENIVLSPQEFLLGLSRQQWGQGACLVFDEAGVGMNAKMFMSTINRAVENIMETFRRQNIAVIFTVPSHKNVDKDVRRLLHSYMQTVCINKQRKQVKVRFFKINYNPMYDQMYFKYLRAAAGNKLPNKLKYVWIGKPNAELIEQYELKRDKFQQRLNEETYERIMKDRADKMPDKSLKEVAGEIKQNIVYYIKVHNKKPRIDHLLVAGECGLSVSDAKQVRALVENSETYKKWLRDKREKLHKRQEQARAMLKGKY